MATPIESLRAQIVRLNLKFSFDAIAGEAGFDRHGSSYVRKFAAGEIMDLTTQRYFALKDAVTRLKRRANGSTARTA